MRFFLDCEFNEGDLSRISPRPHSGSVIRTLPSIELISIGVVSENGDEFYREADFDPQNSNPWVRENVWPHLANKPVNIARHGNTRYSPDLAWALPVGGNSNVSAFKVGDALQDFVDHCIREAHGKNIISHSDPMHGLPTPKFWGYYSAYDWVRLCWCFGKMVDLPSSYPMYCRDLKQVLDSIGNPEIPREVATGVEDGDLHNALDDARYHWRIWKWLDTTPQHGGPRIDAWAPVMIQALLRA